MQTIYIVSYGSFHRPVDTPAGKKDYVGEITFWYGANWEGERLPNISQVFRTKAQADKFVGQELHKLFRMKNYRFRNYAGRTSPLWITAKMNE